MIDDSNAPFPANFTTTKPAEALCVTPENGTDVTDGYDLNWDTVQQIAHELDPDGTRHLALVPGEEKADNDLRAAWGFLGMWAYRHRVHGDSDEEFTSAISDLMSDLMHLCDAVGIDPNYVVEKATDSYTSELYGQP
jgi:hypothetical protein